MPGWQGEQTADEIEIATLKRAKHKLDDLLVDRDNELRLVREENVDLKRQIKELSYQASHEARQAAEAQNALEKKTEALNNLKIQKENAEGALFASEATVKNRDAEIKKLTYQLEVTSVRSATAANEKVAEEKAALEKRVHKLSMDLQKAQLELGREQASNQLSSEIKGTNAAGSKIARPPSRSSIAPVDTARSRFGFQSSVGTSGTAIAKSSRTSTSTPDSAQTQSSSIRPPSALSSHSSIPGPSKLPGRRPSISNGPPSSTTVNTSSISPTQQVARIAQLETSLSSAQDTITYLTSDLEQSQATVKTLETTLETTQTQLSKKKDELLRVENGLMALERSSKEAIEALDEKVKDARDDAEVAKEEWNELREELEREMESIVKDAKREKLEAENRYEALVQELETLEEELQKREGEREDLVRLLNESVAREGELKESLEEKEEECVELENELAYLEETHGEAMEEATTSRRKLEDEIAEFKRILADPARQGEDSEGFKEASAELERLLEDANIQREELRSELSQAEVAQAEAHTAVLSATAKVDSQQIELRELRERLEIASTPVNTSIQGLEARIVTLEAESADQLAEIDLLTNRLSQFEELASAHEQLVDDHEALGAGHKAQSRELEDVYAKLEDLSLSNTPTRQLADKREEDARMLAETIEKVTVERDQLLLEVSKQSDAIVSLKAELDSSRRISSRSYDDAHVEDLKLRLAGAENDVKALQDRLDELENEEWASDQTRRDTANRLISLEGEILRLQEQLEAQRGVTLAAELELGSVTKSLNETKEELANLEGLLDSETRGRERAEEEVAQLAERLDEAGTDTFTSSAKAQELEHEINHLHEQLDELRAHAEDEAYAHMQEVTDLQLRLRSQENEVEDLQRELSVLEALRHILGETEARVDSLGWDLKAAHSAASGQQVAAEEKWKALNERFEANEEECLRLRSELDETRHKLSNAQDALDQAQADFATATHPDVAMDKPSPAPRSPRSPTALSPSSYFFGLSPGSDPSILVSRLREERDELRARLDFARTEADFRVRSLQKRLEESEESKTRVVSLMEVDLLDKTTALEHECDTNARIEEALRVAKNEKNRIEEDLEAATRELKLATTKVDDFEKRLQEAEKAKEEHESGLESAWALEGELAAATRSAETVRSQLDAANASNDELTSSLKCLRSDLRQAEAELDRQHALAAEANARIIELEEALAAARREEESRQNEALTDFATLCESLESDVCELRKKIAQQTSVINEREQSISLLQLNLAVRVALDDDNDDLEDEEEEVNRVGADRSIVDEEELSEGDRTIAVEPSSSPSHLAELEARLSEELSIRLELEQQLANITDQLEHVRRQAQSSGSSVLTLENELQETRHLAREREERMLESLSAFTDLRSRHDAVTVERDSLTSTVESLRQNLSHLELSQSARARDLGNLQAAVDQKQTELEQACDRIRSLEGSMEELETSTSTAVPLAQEQIKSLEQQLADVEDRLSQTLTDLVTSDERSKLAQTSFDNLQERHAALCTELQQLEQSFDQQRADAEAYAGAQSEIERLQRQLTEAGEITILHEQAQRRIATLEEQLAATQESLASAATVSPDEALVSELSERLDAALREVDELSTLLDQERTATATITAKLEEAVEAEKDTSLKAQAVGERAAKEIQTLRQLGRASQAEAEALAAEVGQMRAQIVELEAHIEDITRRAHEDLQQLSAKKEQDIEEVVVSLEHNELQIKKLDEAIAEKEARIEELEQNAQGQLEEIDEANENLIEALKVQKKYEAQVERLKSKVVALQRDLAQAKLVPPTVVESAATMPKKRPAPAEFDPLPQSSASPAPRAIVATRPTSLSLDKENSLTTRTRPSSAPLASKKVDSIVPLKAEHQPIVSRTALRQVDENSAPGNNQAKGKPASPASATVTRGGNAKLDELKAKLAAQKKRSRSGLSAPSATH